MANYYGVSRTNYFRVTDEDSYMELFSNLCSEDTISDFTEVRDGVTWHGFGSYGSIEYYAYTGEDCDEDDYEYDIDEFFSELQKILPDDEAFILMESGHEKLRYLAGYAVIVTRNEIRKVDIISDAVRAAREMLGDEFITRCEY